MAHAALRVETERLDPEKNRFAVCNGKAFPALPRGPDRQNSPPARLPARTLAQNPNEPNWLVQFWPRQSWEPTLGSVFHHRVWVQLRLEIFSLEPWPVRPAWQNQQSLIQDALTGIS